MADHGMDMGLPEDWVHSSYRLETWKKQYLFKINHVVGRHLWVKNDWPTTLLLPKIHGQIGRPKEKGKKEKECWKGLQVTCKISKGKGHNKRGCKLPQAQAASQGQASASQGQASQSQPRSSPQPESQPQSASQPQAASQQASRKRKKHYASQQATTHGHASVTEPQSIQHAATPVQAYASQPQVQAFGGGGQVSVRTAASQPSAVPVSASQPSPSTPQNSIQHAATPVQAYASQPQVQAFGSGGQVSVRTTASQPSAVPVSASQPSPSTPQNVGQTSSQRRIKKTTNRCLTPNKNA
ncbi:transposase, mutator type [Artemisia annua]|uniref:Transposase, mutator type n=1 Tax=Artemisia annua TaxID=35608 RepID=A0A2U1LYU5_ARTAN|nr:transposase, mutator type [Artemisia annua]